MESVESVKNGAVGNTAIMFRILWWKLEKCCSRESSKDQARSTYGRMGDLARNSLPGPMKPEVKMSLVGMRLLLRGPSGGPDARYGLPSSIGPLPPRHFRCQMESRIKWCTMIRAALGRRTVHDTALLKGKAHAGFLKENCRILGRPLSSLGFGERARFGKLRARQATTKRRLDGKPTVEGKGRLLARTGGHSANP